MAGALEAPLAARSFSPTRIALGIAALGIATGLSAQAAAQPKAAPLCTADAHTLCLDGGRFSVTATFQQTASGPSTPANAVPLTDQTGYFWFFDPSNIEIVGKVLDGCTTNEFFWYFAAGLTNVGVTTIVQDLQSGTMKTYTNPVGTAFAPIQDTSAFPTCP
jgi:hypothetical protein